MSIVRPMFGRRLHSGLLSNFNRRRRAKPRMVNGPVRLEQRGIDKGQGNVGVGSTSRVKKLNQRRYK